MGKSMLSDMKKQLKDACDVIQTLKDQALAKKKDMNKPEKVADVKDDRSADEKLMSLRMELSDVLADLKVTKDNVAKEKASEKREVETKSKKSLDELKKELDEIKD